MAKAQADEELSDLDDIDALLEEAEQALEEAEPETLTDADVQQPEPEASAEAAPESDQGAGTISDFDLDAVLQSSPSDASQDKPVKGASSTLESEAFASEAGSKKAQDKSIEADSGDVLLEKSEAQAIDKPQDEKVTVPAQVKAEQEQPVDAEIPTASSAEKAPVKNVQEAQDKEEPPIPAHHKTSGALKKKSKQELTAADMDKLKKLILALGITTIVLVTIGIGLTVWAAIAASTAHLDEESKTLLEEIKTGVEHVAVKSERQDKTLEAIEKKIDALSFQLEQINSDLGKLEALMEANSVKPASSTVDTAPIVPPPHGAGQLNMTAQTHAAPAAPAHTVASVVAKVDPDLKKTLGSLNSRLIRTQKQVDKVYSALRKLQTQYRVILTNLKKLRAELQTEQKPAAAKEPPLKRQYYQYEAPAYDPANIGTYP